MTAHNPPHDPACTTDHHELDCTTPPRTITGPGIDGTITTWGATSPTRGRRIHIIADCTITAPGLHAISGALRRAHRYLTT